MLTLSARKVWTSEGWRQNHAVAIENGHIVKVVPCAERSCTIPVLIPGMIDLHIHGSQGYTVLNPDPAAAENWLHTLASHGVTAILACISTVNAHNMHQAVRLFASMMDRESPDGARVLGVHLEGPFINAVKKGGMRAECILPPTMENWRTIVGDCDGAIRLVSLAPEMEGALDMIRFLRSLGVRTNAGHSNATAAEMRAAIDTGLDGVTHFFNAARPIHHREPGLLVEALLHDEVYCEMISDLVHLAPETVRFLVRFAGVNRVAMITDAVPLTGLADGEYGEIVVTDGSPRKRDGTLTGSRWLHDQDARALMNQAGIDPWDVFYMACHTPARRIGLTDCGDIAPGLRADLVCMSEDYHVLSTFVSGRQIASMSSLPKSGSTWKI